MIKPPPTLPKPEPLPRPEPLPQPEPGLPGEPAPKPPRPVTITRPGQPRATNRRVQPDSRTTGDSEQHVIRRDGESTLVQSESGYSWILRADSGEIWYWHPDEAQWTLCPCACSSPEHASLGLDTAEHRTTKRPGHAPLHSETGPHFGGNETSSATGI
jgi:hypothetical protein